MNTQSPYKFGNSSNGKVSFAKVLPSDTNSFIGRPLGKGRNFKSIKAEMLPSLVKTRQPVFLSLLSRSKDTIPEVAEPYGQNSFLAFVSLKICHVAFSFTAALGRLRSNPELRFSMNYLQNRFCFLEPTHKNICTDRSDQIPRPLFLSIWSIEMITTVPLMFTHFKDLY